MLEIGTPSHSGFRELTVGCGDTGREKSTYATVKPQGLLETLQEQGVRGGRLGVRQGRFLDQVPPELSL